MKKFATAFVFILVATCPTAGHSATTETSNPPTSSSSAADEPSSEISRFRAESRQVLVEANVWNPGATKHAISFTSSPYKPPKGWPTPARGLALKDFHVFDNRVEQRINFLKELDFDVRPSDPWSMEPDTRGTWATYYPGLWEYATATYLIGYAPPSLQPGECRSVSVVVEGHDVDLNRIQYCNPEVSKKAALTATESQMEALLNSQGQRPINLSIQAFSFWSSGVLRLLTEPPSQSGSSVEPSSDYTYVVQVRDSKTPASVHIAAEFQWRNGYWRTTDCLKENPSVHILGTVFKANGEVETQFEDSISCPDPTVTKWTPSRWAARWYAHTLPIPTRFDTQVELPPGDYQLRVLVSDGTSVGRAQIPLHVETLNGHQLAISDVVLGGIVRDASWVPREVASVYPAPIIPTPLVSKGVQFFPSTDNRVPRQAPVSFYFEIYEPLLETQTTAVSFSVKITNLKSNSLAMDTGPLSAAEWVVPGNAVIPIGLKLNIKKLKRGSYRLEIQASNSEGRVSEWRQATFEIR